MSDIDTQGYVYVMISTLNQMVNYIPLRHFKFDDIYNLTIKESNYVDNSRWDENLSKVLKEDGIEFDVKSKDKNLTFEQDDINDIDIIIDALEAKFSSDKNKIFWNITGGQRPFVLAINKFIKDNDRIEDYICYLEGNKSKMVILQDDEIVSNDCYNLNDLNIKIALALMGFDIKETKTSERNFTNSYDSTERKKYLSYLDEYIKNKKLRENLILLNKDDKKDNAKKEIKKIIDIDDKELDRNKAFGYILEKLAGYKILDLAKDKIADMTLGEKINYLRDEDKADEHAIDEFDIALLTKNGKFIIFECKSGGMEGDVAKSTKYSTYAVSGVYGLPILITPLLEKEITAIRKKSHLEDEEFKYLKNDLYKSIRQAINSAIRAGLEVWGLDDIEKNLKKYIEL